MAQERSQYGLVDKSSKHNLVNESSHNEKFCYSNFESLQDS